MEAWKLASACLLPRAFFYGGFSVWDWSELYCACLVVAWVCCGCRVAFVECTLFDLDEFLYWHGMRETVGVDPSEAALTLEEVGAVRVAFS